MAALTELVGATRGHFRFESGHHGDLWLDLDTLFTHPREVQPFAAALAERLARHRAEVVCGPLVGGAFVAQMVASELAAGFCWSEQPDYAIPAALRSHVDGARVAIVDDAINAGSATRATLAGLRACGAEVVALGALLILGDRVEQLAAAEGLPLAHVATLPTHLWEPAACPLCAAGEPLSRPAADQLLPFPEPPLGDDLVTLRPWSQADVPAVVAACQDPLIARMRATVPSPYRESDARAFLAAQEPARRAGVRLELAIVDRSSGVLLGSLALSVERAHDRGKVGYWLAPEARGRGAASAAVRLISAWALDHLGLARLEMFIEPENVASQRVAERSGYVREGLLRSHWLNKGRRTDSIVYGLVS
jgi:orotate phosphoribosyltransferase